MIQKIADKVVAGDFLSVRPSEYTYIGQGDTVRAVIVKEVITLDTDPDGAPDVPYPLFKVEKPDGTEDTYTHKFFADRYGVDENWVDPRDLKQYAHNPTKKVREIWPFFLFLYFTCTMYVRYVTFVIQ